MKSFKNRNKFKKFLKIKNIIYISTQKLMCTEWLNTREFPIKARLKDVYYLISFWISYPIKFYKRKKYV